jgi:signal peptidase I
MARVRSLLPIVGVYLCLAVTAVLFVGRYVPVRVKGGSMRPALRHGDVVLVRRDVMPAEGEIALLRSGPAFVLHRVRVVRGNGALVTRGDANPVDDFRETPRRDVRGEVVAVIPVGAFVERWR